MQRYDVLSLRRDDTSTVERRHRRCLVRVRSVARRERLTRPELAENVRSGFAADHNAVHFGRGPIAVDAQGPSKLQGCLRPGIFIHRNAGIAERLEVAFFGDKPMKSTRRSMAQRPVDMHTHKGSLARPVVATDDSFSRSVVDHWWN
jgi:hypothetical protein